MRWAREVNTALSKCRCRYCDGTIIRKEDRVETHSGLFYHLNCFIEYMKENISEMQSDIEELNTVFKDNLANEDIKKLKWNRKEKLEKEVLDGI